MTDWSPAPSFTRRFWIGSAIVLLSVVFLAVSAVQWANARALAAHSITVTALVTETRVATNTSGTSRGKTHYVSYEFEHGGTVQSFERSVPATLFETFPTGRSFPLRVHPKIPRIHDLYPGETGAQIPGFIVVSLLTLAFGLGLVLSKGNLAALRARFF